MEFTTEQLDFIKACTDKGVLLARQSVFAEALKPVPNFSPDLSLEALGRLTSSGLDICGVALVIDVYETAYPHFQAFALALRALTSEPRDFGCAPQQL